MVAQTSLAHMIPLAKRYVQTLGETLCPGAPPAPLMYPRSCAWIRQIAPVRQLLGAFTGMADFELLSASFANVAVDQVVAEIEGALAQLLKFLGFDRSAFAEVVDGDKHSMLGSSRRRKAALRGPIPAHFNWFTGQLLSGRTVVIRSHEDVSREEAAAAEYCRRIGICSQLLVPPLVGGRVVATVGFGAFRSTREWPDEFIARVRVIGEVMAQALVRTRPQGALVR
jgi:hypothetical protein